jgi:hypothetical protein
LRTILDRNCLPGEGFALISSQIAHAVREGSEFDAVVTDVDQRSVIGG